MMKLNCVKKGNRKRVRDAAHAYFWERKPADVRIHWEHDRWWVLVNTDDGVDIYSIVDASGGQSVDGFDFEHVGRT